MEPWWESVAGLGREALTWLLGLATHGGTDRDKPPTLGAGKTSNVSMEIGKVRRYAELNGLTFDDADAKAGYQTLRRVEVTARNGQKGQMLTKAKGGGHMQLTTPGGISVFHQICGNVAFRAYLETALGVGEKDKAAGVEVFPADAPVRITTLAQAGETLEVEASFACVQCDGVVTHRYAFDGFAERYQYVQVDCPACKLSLRHFKGGPWPGAEPI